MIPFFLDLQIPADDKGPQMLCDYCRNKVKRFLKFRADALESEKKLKVPVVEIEIHLNKVPKIMKKEKEDQVDEAGLPIVKKRMGRPPKAMVSIPKPESPIKIKVEPPEDEEGGDKDDPSDHSSNSVEDSKDFALQNNTHRAQNTTTPAAEDGNELIEIIDMNDIKLEKEEEPAPLPKKKMPRKPLKAAIKPPKRDTPSVYKFPGISTIKKDRKPYTFKQDKSSKEEAEAELQRKLMRLKVEQNEKRRYVQESQLKVERVNADIPLLCPLCNAAFSTYYLFRQHFDEEHENDVLPSRHNSLRMMVSNKYIE